MTLRLVREGVSHNTVECLRDLLTAAETGEIVGLAFGAILKGRRYMVGTSGEAHRNPTFARGMICAIDDELSQIIQSRADQDTTM